MTSKFLTDKVGVPKWLVTLLGAVLLAMFSTGIGQMVSIANTVHSIAEKQVKEQTMIHMHARQISHNSARLDELYARVAQTKADSASIKATLEQISKRIDIILRRISDG